METREVSDEVCRVSGCFHSPVDDDTVTSFYYLGRTVAGLQQIPLLVNQLVSLGLRVAVS